MSVGWVKPDAPQYQPGGQSVHSVTEVLPVALLKVPETHDMGSIEALGQ